MYKSATTIEDIFRLALPGETKLLAGSEFLQRTVSWACSLRPSPPAFPKLDGNEIALIDMDDLRKLDPQMRINRVVESLQTARIAAIAVLGQIDPSAIAAAVSARLTLFQLPSNTQITQVERSIIRLIVDRAGHIAQRSAELQRELNQITLNNGGMNRIVEQIYHFIQQPVILMRDDGQLFASAGLESLAEITRQSLFHGLPNTTTLRSWMATQAEQSLTNVVGVLALNGSSGMPTTQQVVVSPIAVGEVIRGYCLLLRNTPYVNAEVSAVEEIAAQQGAAAAALEWAKQNAVGVAEERMRATFVDELLASEIADPQAWIQRGSSLGFDLTCPHVAWLIEAKQVSQWPAQLLRFIEEHNVVVPYTRRDEGMLLFWPVDNPQSGRELKSIAEELVSRIQASYPKAKIIIGLSRPATDPSQWLHSQQQARESWRLGKEWKGAAVTYFGDLGLYQMLSVLSNSPEAARFYRKTLGKLMSYDSEKNAELIPTLEGFFACHGNLSQTASKLHIHRNTLTYRLEQIATIAQLDLEDPDARFSLQLALKLRPVIK
jgi:purine catabolism regulator